MASRSSNCLRVSGGKTGVGFFILPPPVAVLGGESGEGGQDNRLVGLQTLSPEIVLLAHFYHVRLGFRVQQVPAL